MMKILVCGANGFVGKVLCHRLIQEGHQVIRGVRHPSEDSDIAIDYTVDLSPEQWRDKLDRLDAVDVVINAVGIIIERGTQSFHCIHTGAPIALFSACCSKGVRVIVQISALGAQSQETPYFASKYAADSFLLSQPVSSLMRTYVIYPGLLYGDEGASARFFRMLASLPLHALPAGGHQILRPVHVEDLAKLVLRLIDPTLLIEERCIQAVGATEVSYRQMLSIYRAGLGFSPAIQLPIPATLIQAVALVGQYIPGVVLTPDAWHMLQRGNTAPVEQMTRLLGHPPRGIHTFIDPNTAPILRQQALNAWRKPLRWGLLILVVIVGIAIVLS